MLYRISTLLDGLARSKLLVYEGAFTSSVMSELLPHSHQRYFRTPAKLSSHLAAVRAIMEKASPQSIPAKAGLSSWNAGVRVQEGSGDTASPPVVDEWPKNTNTAGLLG